MVMLQTAQDEVDWEQRLVARLNTLYPLLVPIEGAGELVRRAQQGDGDAFIALFDHYHGLVHNYITMWTVDRLAAEVFSRFTWMAARKQIMAAPTTDLTAWLLTLARTVILDHPSIEELRLVNTVPGHPQEELLRTIQQLTSLQQECLVLRAFLGLDVATMAEVLGMTEEATTVALAWALRRLHEMAK